jgi:hypothetical protein
MSEQKIDIDKVFDEMTPILNAFRGAFESVVHDHAWRGLPIIGWRDGMVTYTDPNDYYRDGTVARPPHLTLPLTTSVESAIPQQPPANA